MKKYHLLLLPLVFTACVDNTPQPVALVKEFRPYNPVQQSCIALSKDTSMNKDETLVFEKVNTECVKFIEVLEGANLAFRNMKLNKNNASYYPAKEKYKKEKKRLRIEYRYLTLILKDQGLDAIENDNLDVFTKIIGFSSHPMNISYYNYMQKYNDVFKDNKKRLRFQKKYANKKYEQGYVLVNKGKYTEGLSDLLVAAKMKHIKAARLCGDVFTDIYPTKSASCYSYAVQSGDKSSLYHLGQYYEEEGDLPEAYAWYEKSANAGNFIAQFKLYELDKNQNEKQVWLKKAAQSGYDKAQYQYGMYLIKEGKTTEAKKYLQMAVNQKYSEANYPLGKLYFQDKKYKQAYALLNQADENADSMYMLGYMNEYAKGTSKNYYSASMYYQKAKKLGKKGVQKDINRMAMAKKRLKLRQIKQQEVQAKASVEQIRENRLRREEVAREDRRIKGEWMAKKAEANRLKVQACGAEPTDSSLRREGTRIHLEGKLSHWLGKNSFIINVNGQEYYVTDEDDKARVNKGDFVNFVAVSTGKREITHGLKRSIFEEADEAAIEKAYALDFEGVCPY